MARNWSTKTFKSGNSVAVRIPKALGIKEGEEVVIAPHPDGAFSFWRASDARSVFMSLFGSMSPGYMEDGRGDTDQVERDWDPSTRRPDAA
jgi:antitoxin VapB